MRAAVYTRVSSDPRGIGRSVAEQEADCRTVAQAEGWEVVRVFCDQDRSASRYAKQTRPEYQALADYVARGECDVLVTWEASRFQRDLQDYVKLRELCRDHGVLMSYSGRLYDLSRTDDRLSTGLDALLAERESDMTRERVVRAMRANAVNGRPHGKLLYGYTREYDPRSGALIAQHVLPMQAEVIREAAKRFLAGEAPYRIAQDFNARGITAARGGSWNLTQIRRLLTNVAYISQRKHQGEIMGKGDWPPILDEATFQRCAAKFANPSRKHNRDSAVKHLLTGIAKCGVCGSPMKYGKPRGYTSYICPAKHCVARKQAPVDELVTEAVLRLLERPDALGLFVQDDDDGVLDEISELRARLEGFYDSAAIGEITPAALGRIEASMLEQIKQLELQVREYSVPTVIYDLMHGARELWPTLAITQQREVVKCLLEVQILPTRSGVRTFDPESVRVTVRRSLSVEPAAPR